MGGESLSLNIKNVEALRGGFFLLKVRNNQGGGGLWGVTQCWESRGLTAYLRDFNRSGDLMKRSVDPLFFESIDEKAVAMGGNGMVLLSSSRYSEIR